MRKSLLYINILIILSVSGFGQTILSGNIKTFGGKGIDILNQIKTFQSNMIMIGCFDDTLKINDFSLPSKGCFDGFLVKTDSIGQVLWGERIGGRFDDNITSLTTDSSGNIYILGYFQKKANLGSFSLTANFYKTYFVAKYSPSGRQLWKKKFDKDNRLQNCKVQIGGNNHIYFTGSFSDTLFVQNQSIVSRGENDIFLIKLDSTGTLNWVKTFGGVGNDIVNTIVTDGNHKVTLGGSFTGSFQYQNTLIPSNGGTDIYLLKVNPNGNVSKFFHSGGEFDEEVSAIAIDSLNRLFVSGVFNEKTNINSDTILTHGYQDIFLFCIDSTYIIDWLTHIGGRSNDYISDIILTKDRDIYVTGRMGSTCYFHSMSNNVPLDSLINTNSDSYCFIAKYNKDGIFSSSREVWSSKEVIGQSIVQLNESFLEFGGTFRRNIIGQFQNDTVSISAVGKKDCFFVIMPILCKGVKVNLGNDTVLIAGQSIQLDAGAEFNQYIWQDSIQGERYFQVNEPGRFWVSVSNADRCYATDSITIRYSSTKSELKDESISEGQVVSVYPNPTSDKVFINFSNQQKSLATIQIYSLSGSLLLLKDITITEQTSVDLSQFPVGAYILKVSADQDNTFKIIKIK
jgi:hypothetical protein